MNLWAFGLAIAIIILITIFIINISKYHKCKYGEIQKDGFQYCEKCNRAIQPRTQSCQHKWKTTETSSITTYRKDIINDKGSITGKLYIQQCEKCGKMQDYKTDVRR